MPAKFGKMVKCTESWLVQKEIVFCPQKIGTESYFSACRKKVQKAVFVFFRRASLKSKAVFFHEF
jgi:hypothetical protein